MQFSAGPSWNTARPRSTRPDLIRKLNAKGILCRTRRTCHIFWAIVSLEILITRTWKANQTAYGRTPRIGREEHSLGGAALAGLLRIRIWEDAFNSTSLLLVIDLSVTLKGRTTHNNVRGRHLNCKDDTEILGASLTYECRLPLPLYLLQTQLSRIFAG